MAIFNSYVKLPEGTYFGRVLSASSKELVPLIWSKFGLGPREALKSEHPRQGQGQAHWY